MRLKKLFLFSIFFTVIGLTLNIVPAVLLSAAGTIGLSLASGPVGSSVSVSGNGYTNSAAFTVTFAGTNITSGQSSATGDINASFSVPLKSRGTYTVTLSDGANTNSSSFTITPSISAGSSSGYVGDTFYINGNGFTAGSTITLFLDSATAGTAFTDANGAFSSTAITIIEISRGSHSIRGSDSSGSSNSVSININPKLILTSVTAAPGSQITVSGNGYSASSTISFYVDDVPVSGSSVASSLGSFSAVTLTVPSVPGGTHTLRAQDSGGGSATASISVVAVISLNPQNGHANSGITVTGKGFGVNKPVTLTWKGLPISSNPASLSTDNNGAFAAAVTALAGQAGSYTVSASDGTLSASADFSMTASINSSTSIAEVGGNFTLSGIGFNPGAAVTIKVDNLQIASIASDTTGAISTNIVVPPIVAGSHTITASDGVITTQTSITVASSIILSPVSGYVGSDVTVKGNGFLAGRSITIKYEDILNTTATSDASGSFSVSFKAPVSKGGNHTVSATDGTNTKTTTFAMDSTPPPVPTNLLPADKSNADALAKFTWAPSTDPSSVTYELQVSTDAGFATVIMEKREMATPGYQTIETEKFKTTGSDAPYYWRVRAIDGAGNASDWTSPQSFSVGFILPTWGIYVIFVLLILVAAVGGFWVGRRTSFKWDW